MPDVREEKMKIIDYKRIETPLGYIRIEADRKGISGIYFCGEEETKTKEDGRIRGQEESSVILEAERQLREYMEGRRKKFELPLSIEGTEFQKKVWQELCRIPYGETRTYGQIAALVGNPKAGRAVGMANHKNPISIVVPCHRVIGANQKLVGYGGGLDKKKALLELESRYSIK